MNLQWLQRLRELDTCAVSDAMDRIGAVGAALGLRALTVERKIAGIVATVQLAEDDGRPSKRHLCTAAVEASGAGTVIVVAHNGRTDVAGWGGILSTSAVFNGVEGVVIDGACRDIDESRELQLPIYGRGGVPVTARGRVVEQDWNCEIVVCGIAVRPGDYVIADGSGVVFVPAGDIARVVVCAEGLCMRERDMVAAVRSGMPVSTVMGGGYENMLKEPAR